MLQKNAKKKNEQIQKRKIHEKTMVVQFCSAQQARRSWSASLVSASLVSADATPESGPLPKRSGREEREN